MPGQPAWRDLPDPEQRQSAREFFLDRQLDQLPKDMVHLYDLVDKLRKENDFKARALLNVQAELDHAHRNLLLNWLFTVGQAFALITALIKLFWLR